MNQQCPVPGCTRPRCRGVSVCCYEHALMTLGYNGAHYSREDRLIWCGRKPRKRARKGIES